MGSSTEADSGIGPTDEPFKFSSKASSSSPPEDTSDRDAALTEQAPHINPLLPLSSHYSLLNDTILPAFISSLAAQSYSIAYAVGVQFVEMALVSIPSHSYFDRDWKTGGEEDDAASASAAKGDVARPSRSSGRTRSASSIGATSETCERERRRSVRDAVRVATILENMVRTERIDDSELQLLRDEENAARRAREAKRLRQLADEAARKTLGGTTTSSSGRNGHDNVAIGDGGKSSSDGSAESWECVGDDDQTASSERSVWEWVADHADVACGKLVDEICAPGPTGTHAKSVTLPQREENRARRRREDHDKEEEDPVHEHEHDATAKVEPSKPTSTDDQDQVVDSDTVANKLPQPQRQGDDGPPSADADADTTNDAILAAALAEDQPMLTTTPEGQFEQDLERALYLSGLDAAKVDGLRDADEERRRRRAEEKAEQRRQKIQGMTIDTDVPRRRISVSSPKNSKTKTKPLGFLDQEDEDGVLILRQSAPKATAAAADATTDGREGPEEEAISLPSLPPLSPVSGTAEFDSISSICRDDFHALRTAGRIRIYPLATSQGRVKGSVNGCTVIAPLIAITHLQNNKEEMDGKDKGKDLNMLDDMDWETTTAESRSSSPSDIEAVDDDDIGVPDVVIEEIIDERAPSILPSIRSKLHLKGDALIIPSDVHDYFIDAGLLHQSQFVSVCGGNILDDNHLGSFLRTLVGNDVDTTDAAAESSKDNVPAVSRQVAATLFFHEHVVCLHRLVVKRRKRSLKDDATTATRSKRMFRRKKDKCKKEEVIEVNEIWFDFIDSLPATRMLPRILSRNNTISSSSIRSDEDIERAGSVDLVADGPGPPLALRHNSSSYALEEESRDALEGADSSIDSGWTDRAVRIRCSDTESLTAMLRWYAYSKFNERDRSHISRCDWNDYATDFDPRVFQAFVWGAEV